jgi:hypothetical protein
MAHKGQPELRIAGLDAVNGEPLSLPGLAKPVTRMSFRTELQGRMPDDGKPVKGKGGAKSKDAADEAADGDVDTDVGAGAEEGSDATSDDTSLDDLLASLGDDADTASTDAAPEDASEEAEMDPDLAALLKSLE